MHTHRIIGATIGASLIALSNVATAQTWPSNDEAAKPTRGSYSGAPAGEGPGTQGSQGQVLQGNGSALPDSTSPNVIVVVVDSESGLDDRSEPRRGPAVVGEPVEDRALSIDIGNELQLLAAKPAWPPRRAAFPHRIRSPLL